MSIEANIRAFVEGYKEIERLERVLNREQSQEMRKQNKDRKSELEAKLLELGIGIAGMVLTDLHRIADGIATIAGPPAK